MKAIALISGGLDSTLAARIIKEQGIEIIALNLKTPFCLCDRKSASGCTAHSRRVAEELKIPLKTVNIAEEFLGIIKKPKYGYGSQMNPCIDCRILKFCKAKGLMQETGAAFIITGEVLGQRPMSQHRRALNIIDRESRLEGLVLRPLSAKLFDQTIPEKKGWVQREKLLSISGRSRKPQIQLARELNINDYPCPAGGCLLTDPEFAKRIKDLMQHDELSLNNIELLKAGRHFRLAEKVRLVVGRDEAENNRLSFLAKENDLLFKPLSIAGPTALGRGVFTKELIELSCRIICRYSDSKDLSAIEITCDTVPVNGQQVLAVHPLAEDELIRLRISGC